MKKETANRERQQKKERSRYESACGREKRGGRSKKRGRGRETEVWVGMLAQKTEYHSGKPAMRTVCV